MTTSNKTISRRNLLSSAAMGTVAFAGFYANGINGAKAMIHSMAGNNMDDNASSYWNKSNTQRYLCSQIHLSKSLELGKIVESPNLPIEEKNLALRTTCCPSCGVSIRPGGEAAGYRIGV